MKLLEKKKFNLDTLLCPYKFEIISIWKKKFPIGHPDCVPINSIEICQVLIYTIWKKIKFPIGHPDCVPINSIEICQVLIYIIWKKNIFPIGHPECVPINSNLFQFEIY